MTLPFDLAGNKSDEEPTATMARKLIVPRPKASTAPKFDGKDVTYFLNEYEEMAIDYGLTEPEKVRKLPLYCSPEVGDYIRYSLEYKNGKWDDLAKWLKREYKREDRAQTIYSLRFLDKLKARVQQDPSWVESFVREYATVSNALVRGGKLDETRQARFFVESLPNEIFVLTCRHFHLDPDEDKGWKWEEIYEFVKQELRYRDIAVFDRPNVNPENAFSGYTKDGTFQGFRDPAEAAEKTKKPVSKAAAPKSQPVSAAATKDDTQAAIEDLTKRMNSLHLPVQQGHLWMPAMGVDPYTGMYFPTNVPAGPPPNPYVGAIQMGTATGEPVDWYNGPMIIPMGGVTGGAEAVNEFEVNSQKVSFNQNAMPKQRRGECYYCGHTGHHFNTCQNVLDDVSNGFVHRSGKDNLWRIGRAADGGPLVQFEKGGYMRQGVFNHWGTDTVLGMQTNPVVDPESNNRALPPGFPNGTKDPRIGSTSQNPGERRILTNTISPPDTNTSKGGSMAINSITFASNISTSQERMRQAACERRVNPTLSNLSVNSEADRELDSLLSQLELSEVKELIKNEPALLMALKRRAEDDMPEPKTRKQGRFFPRVEEDNDDVMQDAPTAAAEPEVQDKRVHFKKPVAEVQTGPPRPKLLSNKGLHPSTAAAEKRAALPKKHPEAPPVTKLSAQLRDATDAMTVVEQILNQKMTLSVKELIGVAPRVHRALFSGLPTSNASVVPSINHLTVQKSVNLLGPDEILYAARAIMAKTTINDFEVEAMIDTGAESNVITRAMANFLGLEIQPVKGMAVTVQTQESVGCLGIVEAAVQMGDIVHHVDMIVMPSGETSVILGRPWQERAQWGCQTLDDGIVDCWVFSKEGDRKLMFTGYIPAIDMKRKTKEDVIRGNESMPLKG